MELPLGGPALRHYTQSRPRPHRQKLNYRPSRQQETIIESDNEVLELMGRVDEGVEEFFTKRVLPTDSLTREDEESITVHEVAPASSVPCPPQSKTLRRKLGDFFTLRKRRGLKSETSQEGRPKKASIADLIRPLREVARAEKEKEKDRVKENEKEKAKEHPGPVTGESAVQETPVAGAPPLRGEAAPPRRAIREGKSQSLILLSGSAAAGTTHTRNTAKKQFEGQHSFEQKLHLMLQRIGVSKAQPGETQNQEGEMKKAESEGTIIDSKPEPPPTFTKPRTMSASADTRHPIRPSVSAHESAGKPALLPKPVVKTCPPPTASGRNTPENELAQIQEAETNTETKLSPTAAPPTPAATTTNPTLPTISNSDPVATNCTTSPSSTVPPSETDTRTDSVKPTATLTPMNVTELDSKPSFPEACATTTELGTTAPIEPDVAPTVTSNTLSLSIPSDSTAITTPSITTLETVSAPSNESPVSTASTNPTLLESNGIPLVDATPAAGGDAAISVATTAPSPSSTTSISIMPPGASTATAWVTEASSVPLVASVTTTISPTPNSSDTIASRVSPEATINPSSIPISSTISTTTFTASPTSNNCTDPTPQPASPGPADASVPYTSSTETYPTDTTTTATSLNRAGTTSSTSSATAAAISSPPVTDTDPPHAKNVSTPTTDNSSAPSHHLSSPAPPHDCPGQDNDLQISPEEISSEEPGEKGTAADEEVEIVQKSSFETDESKKVIDGGKGSENESDKPALVKSKVMNEKEKQDESVKPEGDVVETEVGMTEPVSSGNDAEPMKAIKQEETKSVGEK